MRKTVVGSTDTIRRARRFDGINSRARRTITDNVDVQIKSGHVNALGVLHNHRRLVFELSIGYLALARMIAMRLHEAASIAVLVGVRAHLLAQRRSSVDIPLH